MHVSVSSSKEHGGISPAVDIFILTFTAQYLACVLYYLNFGVLGEWQSNVFFYPLSFLVNIGVRNRLYVVEVFVHRF